MAGPVAPGLRLVRRKRVEAWLAVAVIVCVTQPMAFSELLPSATLKVARGSVALTGKD
jgi:hypothetical protein